MYVSTGKQLADLGNYQQCSNNPKLKYALVIVKNKIDPR